MSPLQRDIQGEIREAAILFAKLRTWRIRHGYTVLCHLRRGNLAFTPLLYWGAGILLNDVSRSGSCRVDEQTKDSENLQVLQQPFHNEPIAPGTTILLKELLRRDAFFQKETKTPKREETTVLMPEANHFATSPPTQTHPPPTERRKAVAGEIMGVPKCVQLLHNKGLRTQRDIVMIMEQLGRDYTHGLVPRDQTAVILNVTGKILGVANLAIRTGSVRAKEDAIAATFSPPHRPAMIPPTRKRQARGLKRTQKS